VEFERRILVPASVMPMFAVAQGGRRRAQTGLGRDGV